MRAIPHTLLTVFLGLTLLLGACSAPEPEPAAADATAEATTVLATVERAVATEPDAAAATDMPLRATRPRPTNTPVATATPSEPTPVGDQPITEVETIAVERQSTPIALPLPEPTFAPAGAPMEKPTVRYPATLQSVVDLMLDDLTARSGVDRSAITLRLYESVTWSDGSLGCPQPGVMYTMALVPGYRFVFAIGEREYNYHSGRSDYFVYCEKPAVGSPMPNPEE